MPCQSPAPNRALALRPTRANMIARALAEIPNDLAQTMRGSRRLRATGANVKTAVHGPAQIQL